LINWQSGQILSPLPTSQLDAWLDEFPPQQGSR
jgi:hypothetical protein